MSHQASKRFQRFAYEFSSTLDVRNGFSFILLVTVPAGQSAGIGQTAQFRPIYPLIPALFFSRQNSNDHLWSASSVKMQFQKLYGADKNRMRMRATLRI